MIIYKPALIFLCKQPQRHCFQKLLSRDDIDDQTCGVKEGRSRKERVKEDLVNCLCF